MRRATLFAQSKPQRHTGSLNAVIRLQLKSRLVGSEVFVNNLRLGSFFLFAPVLIFSVLFPVVPNHCSAQEVPTESKGADISVFGGITGLAPGFVSGRETGGTAGVNFTRYFSWPVAPSVEIRANTANGSQVEERSYLVGFRAQAGINWRYHPYADFMVGKGTIHYDHPAGGYLGDNSTVYSYGGGVDIDVTRNFQAKLDFQEQKWNIGMDASDKFNPNLITIGVAYRIPFRPNVGRR